MGQDDINLKYKSRDEMKQDGDHLVVATALDDFVRAVAVRSTETVRDLAEIHGLSPLATVAAGRLAAGTQLLASDLKNDTDALTVSIKCDGPLGGILMAGGNSGYIRGYVTNPQAYAEATAEKSAVAAAVGEGTLTVVRSIGMKQPWSGTIELINGEIAEDLTYYLAASEQIPGVMSLGVQVTEEGVRHAGGLLVELLPGAPEQTVSYLERRAAGFPAISFLLEEGFTPAEIIDLFIGDPQTKYLELRPAGFRCTCSKERMKRNLLTLGRNDLQELAEDPEGIHLECHFCLNQYHFPQSEVESLLQ